MEDVTRVLSAIEQGDPRAAERLLPLVYDELRKLAAQKLAHESPGQTLDATALVHEAYLRLVGAEKAQRWDSRGHFFAACAEAMRRILIDNARRKQADKHGGGWQRHDLLEAALATRSALSTETRLRAPPRLPACLRRALSMRMRRMAWAAAAKKCPRLFQCGSTSGG